MNENGLPWTWRATLAAIAATVAAALSLGDVTHRADDLFYDLHASHWGYPVGNDVAMIAVDDRSLGVIGQWPWPRNVHAQLLDRLRDSGVRGIAFDLILSEPDRIDPANDVRLAEAIERNGRVVLPVIATMQNQSGPPIEVLPNPVIASRVAAIGHTDVELEPTGSARELYLHAGLGQSRWPALALALLQLDPTAIGADVPGVRRPTGLDGSPYQWVRDHRVRIRYAGPPGSFPELSYIDVLEGRVPDDALRDRWVVVGVTATGIAPGFRTPMSGLPMNGVEYHANIASMLLHQRAIVPLAPLPQAAIVGLLVFMCTLLSLSPGVMRPLSAAIAGVGVMLAISIAMMRLGNTWFAPMPAAMVVAATHLLWMGRHLLHWRRQANFDTLTLLANRRYFDAVLERRIAAARRAQSPLSLLLIDVDHFKRYNDSEGHLAGDRLLMLVAQAIARHARRSGDLAARFGGDEFALVLPDTPAAGAGRIAEGILATIREQPVSTGLSIGICTCIPDAATSPRTMLEQADAALYRTKQNGRDGYMLASPA
ncbi:CHASE2 domain-containing protein [Marilutibacter maris]|uniref:CHASE2 domain-containing protein n=1 Tax=Marilutibacter maris TaxID=1605891 RepID=UPI001479081E|nr:CHASE2 domain-containing protein [Lysobacter maris]